MTQPGRLRVLIACGSLPPVPCGVGDYTARLARALSLRPGVKAAVLTSRYAGRQLGSADLADFEVLEPIRDWHVGSLRAAVSTARGWRPDLVHIQHPAQGYDGPLPFLLAPAARGVLRVPVVATLHEPVGVNRMLPGVVTLVRAANALVVVRPNFRELIPPLLRWTIAGRPPRFIPNSTALPKVERTPGLVAAVRDRYRIGQKSIVAYFGFVYPSRGVDQLFRIADPARHHLLIVGGRLEEASGYYDEVAALARRDDWAGSASITGFLPEAEAAELVAAADAVVLPFRDGGGVWNTSIHAARLQGTFVVATSKQARGYDSEQNLHFAAPGDISEMRQALVTHLGTRGTPNDVPTWENVAEDHLSLYIRLLRASRRV